MDVFVWCLLGAWLGFISVLTFSLYRKVEQNDRAIARLMMARLNDKLQCREHHHG